MTFKNWKPDALAVEHRGRVLRNTKQEWLLHFRNKKKGQRQSDSNHAQLYTSKTLITKSLNTALGQSAAQRRLGAREAGKQT